MGLRRRDSATPPSTDLLTLVDRLPEPLRRDLAALHGQPAALVEATLQLLPVGSKLLLLADKWIEPLMSTAPAGPFRLSATGQGLVAQLADTEEVEQITPSATALCDWYAEAVSRPVVADSEDLESVSVPSVTLQLQRTEPPNGVAAAGEVEPAAWFALTASANARIREVVQDNNLVTVRGPDIENPMPAAVLAIGVQQEDSVVVTGMNTNLVFVDVQSGREIENQTAVPSLSPDADVTELAERLMARAPVS
jgi:hypothetical protein